MLYMIPEQLGRCNLNWAEEGRNVEHHDRKMLKISLFWSSQTDFGLLSIGRNVSLNVKKQFLLLFQTFDTPKRFCLKYYLGRNPPLKFKTPLKYQKVVKRSVVMSTSDFRCMGSTFLNFG